jgi:hypothetical protein
MKLKRYAGNPILSPRDTHWEKMQVRNPAAWFDGERVVMIYSARSVSNTIYLGLDGGADTVVFLVSIGVSMCRTRRALPTLSLNPERSRGR